LARLTQCALELLIRNRLGTFDHSDLDLRPLNQVFFLLPRMDVRTKFEEGRSR